MYRPYYTVCHVGGGGTWRVLCWTPTPSEKVVQCRYLPPSSKVEIFFVNLSHFVYRIVIITHRSVTKVLILICRQIFNHTRMCGYVQYVWAGQTFFKK